MFSYIEFPRALGRSEALVTRTQRDWEDSTRACSHEEPQNNRELKHTRCLDADGNRVPSASQKRSLLALHAPHVPCDILINFLVVLVLTTGNLSNDIDNCHGNESVTNLHI